VGGFAAAVAATQIATKTAKKVMKRRRLIAPYRPASRAKRGQGVSRTVESEIPPSSLRSAFQLSFRDTGQSGAVTQKILLIFDFVLRHLDPERRPCGRVQVRNLFSIVRPGSVASASATLNLMPIWMKGSSIR
jgi:hypothetical protein